MPGLGPQARPASQLGSSFRACRRAPCARMRHLVLGFKPARIEAGGGRRPPPCDKPPAADDVSKKKIHVKEGKRKKDNDLTLRT